MFDSQLTQGKVGNWGRRNRGLLTIVSEYYSMMRNIALIIFYLLLVFLLSSSSSTMKGIRKSVRKEKELMKHVSEPTPVTPLKETDQSTFNDDPPTTTTVIEKAKKKKTKKRKVMPKLNWWSGVHYFLRSVVDPTCAGFIKCRKSPRVNSHTNEGMMMAGVGPSFGPVCGPNGCF